MLRKAFRMSVNRGQAVEYERRHRPIWPELEETLIRHGVTRYSIYLDHETGDLFAYLEIRNEQQWADIAATDVAQRWWRYMRDLMPTNADNSPVTRGLREVFHLSA